ncbi:MAG: hypothetical protein JWR26_721 [Pedosphaera sp.]|nr:hypothetical protein [Pedosphaera sp.]
MALGLPRHCEGAAKPIILITNMPAYGSMTDLSGSVLLASPSAYAVAVFIYVPGSGWWSKPTCPGQPLTTIQPDGSWTADVTTGGVDQNATRFAALVVGTNYNEPCVLGLANIPTNVYAQAAASAVVTREYPGPRWVNFSGYDWWVKTSTNQVGPGPNYFSDSTNNVWVDGQGWLHLRLTNRSNQWQCAELVSARTFGYGSYRFELNSVVNNLDPHVTLGLFTWSDDPAYTYREIDVECSRWSVAADTNNSQFVVQPYNLPGQWVRYQVPPNVTNSTHLFTWETNRISFQSMERSYSPGPVWLLSSYVFTNAPNVPQTGDENVRMNLWLNNGPPTDNQEVEVVVKSFQFVPLGPPQAAIISQVNMLANGQFQFALLGEPDRRYQVQSSANLISWQDLGTILATNSSMTFVDTNSSVSGRRFYRTVTLP